ncbi:hypothetical protein FOL46_007087 [Perkinsus olseni]|uniref:Uncharacterized protein n=1 Tax=Perkinsus olseni TaxID=32597 RepID=A0A7J6LFU1_PEROL|nr:hypothetical protein FOL46_007087 [Perkinsus olseni]
MKIDENRGIYRAAVHVDIGLIEHDELLGMGDQSGALKVVVAVGSGGLRDSMRKKELFLNDVTCKEQVRLDCIELDELKPEYGSRQEVRAARKLLIDWLAEVIFARIDFCHNSKAAESKGTSGLLLITRSGCEVVLGLGVGVPDPLLLLSRPSYPTRVLTTTLEYPKAGGRKRARRSSCDEVRRTPAVSRRLSEGGVVPMSMSPKAVGGRPPRQVRNSVSGHEGADDFAMERGSVDSVAERIRTQIAELDAQGEASWHLSCLNESSTLQTLRECKAALAGRESGTSENRRALGAILAAVQHVFSRRRGEASDVESLSNFLDSLEKIQTREELQDRVQAAITLLTASS